jgi:ABC-type polysaccharide/polyol phosphate export permease
MKAFPTVTWGHPLVQLTLWRLRQFGREPEAVFWVFCFPIMLAGGLGLAFHRRPPEILKVAAVTTELATSLRREGLLAVSQLKPPEVEETLRLGKVVLVALPGTGATVVYRYDETNPDAQLARLLANRAIQRGAGQVDPIGVKDELIVEPGARYVDFLIPGLLGMTLMGSAAWGIGFPIVDARRKKLMKRMIASPMPRSLSLLSFLFLQLMLLTAEVGTLLGFAVLVLRLPMRGCWLDFWILCVVGSLSFSALGLLIAARVQTAEGASALINIVTMPMFVACGVFFSVQRFPHVLQAAIKLLPLTAITDALRSNMLQGSSLNQLVPELGVLTAWLIVCFTLALRLFRWQ